VAASWTINKIFVLRGGINNIFDKDPPIVTTYRRRRSSNGTTFPRPTYARWLVFMT